jgi:UDP-GlcNAc:undecaprenyl-phosphate GlcNAc-1-phosphate transferase
MLTFALIFFAALIISFVLTPLVRNRAALVGLIDHPSESRQIHTIPTPRAGGIAIFVAFLSALALVFLFHNRIGVIFRGDWPRLARLLAPCAAIFLLGVIDDFRRLSARVKFIAQIAIAVFFYFFTVRITTIGNPLTGTIIDLGWLALPLTVIWLVGITNAFNLIDGIDGLSAGSALFATLAMLGVALANGNIFVIILSCALAGSILGFLKYNFNPATIFMGDGGSLFIGFTLAALAIEGAQKNTAVVAIAIPLVSFGLPIMETTLSIARRFLAGQPLFEADQRHIHHQLLAKGLSTRKVVIILYGVSAVYALVSLLMIDSPARLIGLTLLVFGVSAWLGIQHLGYHEFGEVGRFFQRSLQQRAVIMNNIRINNAIGDLRSAQNFSELLDRLDDCFQTLNFCRVELRLPRIDFADFQSHSHFIVCPQGDEVIALWLNEVSELASLADDETVELRMPFQCPSGMAALCFSHISQTGPLLFDINLLFNNLRVKLEQAILNMNRSAPVASAAADQASNVVTRM